MDIKQAKEYFHLGVISKIHVLPDALDSSAWTICLEGTNDQYWILNTALGKIKSYKSLDTAADEIRSITGRISSFFITT
mgnify:CR=1 FL=1